MVLSFSVIFSKLGNVFVEICNAKEVGTKLVSSNEMKLL